MDTRANPNPPQTRRDDICVHIFTASATLVGVCLTVIGLLLIFRPLHNVSALTDELLRIDALMFLVACIVAYVALRTDDSFRRRRIEKWADIAFLASLAVMTGVCGLIALELV